MNTLKFSAAAIAAFGIAPDMASAAPILSEVGITQVSGNFGTTPNAPVVTSDSAPNGGTAEVGQQSFGNYAIQEGNGNSDVRAISNAGGFLTDFEQVTSSAIFTQQETNTSNATRQFFLNYTVQDLEAELFHFADDFDNNNLALVNPFGANPSVFNESGVTAASFEYSINVNGTVALNTRVDALISQTNGIEYDGFGAFRDSATVTGGVLGAFDLNVDGISGEIILGDFDAGEVLTVTSTLTARAFSHSGSFPILVVGEGCTEGVFDEVFVFNEDCNEDQERTNGTFAFFNDPVTISSIGNRAVATTPSPVPLPAAAWMLIAALGGLGAVRSRKA